MVISWTLKEKLGPFVDLTIPKKSRHSFFCLVLFAISKKRWEKKIEPIQSYVVKRSRWRFSRTLKLMVRCWIFIFIFAFIHSFESVNSMVIFFSLERQTKPFFCVQTSINSMTFQWLLNMITIIIAVHSINRW